jgi:hypothetical protein
MVPMRLSDRMISEAQATLVLLNEHGGQLSALPEARRAFILVYAAQGEIDNGGLENFFESPWPSRPPYGAFVEAYRAIGALGEAACLEVAIGLFTVAEPHLEDDRRVEELGRLVAAGRFLPLDERLQGKDAVWGLLEAFLASAMPAE